MTAVRVERPLPASAPREALPLPAPSWGVADALAALADARTDLGLLARGEAVVVSALTTVVLRCGAHAVKVYPPGTDAGHLERARLALGGVTVALTSSRPPVVTEHGVAVVMPWLEVTGAVGWRDFGTLLRGFHDESAAADLPTWTPLSRLESQVVGLRPEHAAALLGARAELLVELDGLGTDLGVGVLHGDASPQNAVLTADGPRLLDLDWAARGPRELDLVPAVRQLRSGELGRAGYAGFCAAYGADVRGWEGLAVVDRMAALDGLVFRLWDCRHHGRDLDWLDDALRALPI